MDAVSGLVAVLGLCVSLDICHVSRNIGLFFLFLFLFYYCPRIITVS
jgi:hypothetical protein